MEMEYEKNEDLNSQYVHTDRLYRISTMEEILDESTQKMDALEKALAEYEAFQPKIQRLEKYYTSQQWKDDFYADERGELPDDLKRGVLSEDGIYNLLERNKELMERLGFSLHFLENVL